jgi:hypothetical protein
VGTFAVAAIGCASNAKSGGLQPPAGNGASQGTIVPSGATTPAAGGMTSPAAPTKPAGGTTPPLTGAGGSSALQPNGMGAGGSASPATGGGAGMGMAGGTAGGSSTQPGPGGFPKTDPVDTNRMGPHAFMSYTDGVSNPEYDSAIVYYPTDADPPFGFVVFSPGFTATKESYQNFLGPLLASHGIVMMLTTPTTTGDLPQQRAMDLEAAIEQMKGENTRDGSPLKGKLAVDRACVTGHSMGGGGTLFAATDLGNKIRCDAPLQPWQPGMSFAMVSAPTMFIAAQSDTVAGVAQNAMLFYSSIPDSVPKYYVEVAGASHFLSAGDLGSNYDVQSKYLVAFYKVYLEDDMRYLDVLNGPMDAMLSSYMKSK